MNFNNYYPFGLEHKGYNNVVVSEHPYKYNGKELNEELGLDWYDYGFRNYDASLGRWFGVDPLAEEYYSTSPYGFVNNSPLFNLEIDGRFWIPKVNDDGSTSYIAEDGDSAATLASQYGLDQEDAEAITGTQGDAEIDENTEVSGETVNNVTGSEVLKLDDFSNTQHNLEQTIFAAHHAQSKGEYAFTMSNYFNSDGKSLMTIKLDGYLNINGQNTRVVSELPLNNVRGSSIMGASRNKSGNEYVSFAYQVNSEVNIQYTTGAAMGKNGKIANYKINSYLNINERLIYQSYINMTTYPKDARNFKKYYENGH